jgi:hypothetical protein
MKRSTGRVIACGVVMVGLAAAGCGRHAQQNRPDPLLPPPPKAASAVPPPPDAPPPASPYGLNTSGPPTNAALAAGLTRPLDASGPLHFGAPVVVPPVPPTAASPTVAADASGAGVPVPGISLLTPTTGTSSGGEQQSSHLQPVQFTQPLPSQPSTLPTRPLPTQQTRPVQPVPTQPFTTRSGVQVLSFEQAQTVLRAKGVTWQQLTTFGDGIWHFACTIPNPDGVTQRRYEAYHRNGLAALVSVIEQIERDGR